MGRAERPNRAGRTVRSAARPATRLRHVGRGRSRAGDGYVQLERRAFSPVLRRAELPAATRIPWWGGRTIRYKLACQLRRSSCVEIGVSAGHWPTCCGG